MMMIVRCKISNLCKYILFFFSSRRRHTRLTCDWSSDVCSSDLFQKIGGEMLAAMAIPFLVLLVAAVGGNVIQHRLVWSFQALTPRFSKISLAAGLKRLFSKQALANFAKGLIKLVVVGSVLTALMWPERGRLEALTHSDPALIVPLCVSLSLKLLGSVVAMLAVV